MVGESDGQLASDGGDDGDWDSGRDSSIYICGEEDDESDGTMASLELDKIKLHQFKCMCQDCGVKIGGLVIWIRS